MSKEKLIKTFGRDKIFLPVIHPVSKGIALNSIQIAVDANADGIFLIDQGMTSREVLEFSEEVNAKFPGLWIGVNLLDTEAPSVLARVKDFPIKGIWTDNAGINEWESQQPYGDQFIAERKRLAWDGLYFGGVAFKYQRPVLPERLPIAAEKAMEFMDVITTSGAGTGLSAEQDKVVAMRSRTQDFPLALASGISPENIHLFLSIVDVYLVASGIETAKYSGILIPERTKILSEAIHSFRG